ncbi:MAG: M16 family metallopeptidase, partial [Deltaproteobacteria bacterium]
SPGCEMYRKTKFNNGLRVVTWGMPQMRSAAMGIWVRVGGRYETPEYKGISHFLEHMLFKGTSRYSCSKLKESVEGVGGSLNGFTSEEATCYLVKMPAKSLDLALDILSDMVIHPLIPQEEIERERTVILEEIKMYKDQPQSYVYDLLDELLWPAQALGAPVIGSHESVSRIKRKDLQSHRKTAYTPLNIVVSAAGNLRHDKFAKKVDKIFSGLKDKNVNRFLQARQMQDKPQLNLLSKETEQTHLALGFHGFKRDHPLKHALNLLHIILGGNMSSRLFNALREKRGLAYDIGTQVKRFEDTGAFIVHAGIDNRKLTEAIGLIFKELARIKHALVTPGELRRAKEFYLGQLTLLLEDSLDHMLWIGESTVALDKTYSLEEVIKEVSKVQRSDIRDVARSILKEEKINLALIGPVQENREFIHNSLSLK